MMKNRLLFFALLCTFLSFGQQKGEIVLNWVDNVKSSIGDVEILIPQFQSQYMDFNTTSKELLFLHSFPVSSPIKENSLQITNITYENVTREQLGQLSVALLPVTINAKIHTARARNDFYGSISLSPVLKEGGGYKRIKSFSYSYALGGTPMTAKGVNDFDVLSNSVLTSGEWYRFYVEKSGVYKVSRAFLQQLGFKTDVDPRNIKIYGNGGRMLPLKNSIAYPSDLTENAITFIGEQDGVFDAGDYILFYAEGVDNWNEESGTHSNLYADRSYYYITAQGSAGKRISTMGQPTAPSTITITSSDEYLYHEKDLINIARLGRKWHGEAFNVNNVQDFEFVIPDVETSPAEITVSGAGITLSSTSIAVAVNGQAVGVLGFSKPGDNGIAREDIFTSTFTPTGNTQTVKLTYNNNGVPGSNAWLDYIIIKAKRRLLGYGKQFKFQYNAAATVTGVGQYIVGNASGVSEVWDVTDLYNVSKVVNTGAQNQLAFKAWLGEVRKYVSVVPADYYTPLKEAQARVVNQNIKGTIFNNAAGQFQDIDYLIVTPANLSSSAEKLANLHRTQSGLNVKVISLENIYHEFSSGKQDIGAIRNLVKYIYNNASSSTARIKYVNLFGDASFDYKSRIPNNTNVVPIMHGFYAYSRGNGESAREYNYSIAETFVTDDFYGLMDPEEGNMQMFDSGSEGLDVAVGRMLVNDKKQADEMVNKVVEYKSADSYGRWRNEFTVLVDDLDGNGSLNFIPNMDNITVKQLNEGRPFVNVRKFYSDAYVQEASAGGQRYPEVKEQFLRAINYGSLVISYYGHGGEDGLASERLYEKTDAVNLKNKNKYPLFITATCELTKFDNPYRPTVGEYTYWNPAGGAISMITTTRALYISDAEDFNPRIVSELYAYGETEYPTMGEALRKAKLALLRKRLRMICLVGDPALKLAIPKPEILLTHVNGVPLAEFTGALNSLAYVKLAGRVVNGGATMTNYNGELEVTVFDKPIDRTTLDNDGMGGGNKFAFKTLGETIFRGNASVTNGLFEFGFVVPRDIRIPIGEGRVSFYSKKANTLEDQQGYNATVKIGGVNLNAVEDKIAPTVKLYMNDESFVSGGITNASPILLAFLEDEHGINTASGIGHDIVGILDGDENNPYILNDYYETELDNYKKGTLRFPFSNLKKGLHTLTFKAWDVYNNLVTAEIQFVVVGDDALQLEKVLNYPNPFVSYTEFWFTHNRPFEPLDVQVQIFTVTGKVVKTINQSVTTDGFLCRDIKWDGKDDFGDRIGKGVYVYKLTVKSTTTNKTAEKYEKLVLL